MIPIGVISTKGGVGKTTLTANMGGLLADMGFRVLLIDCDIQPSLSKHFSLRYRAKDGLTRFVTEHAISSETISSTAIEGLDIVLSDSPGGQLAQWLQNRADALFRLKTGLKHPYLDEHYDFVLMDTQGARGPVHSLQNAVILGAKLLVSPVRPAVSSAREFLSGMLEKLDELRALSEHMMLTLPTVQTLIYDMERTNDARSMAEEIRGQFIKTGAQVSVLETIIPHSVAYNEAATRSIPVHRHEIVRRGSTPSAYEAMHSLVWEFLPATQGVRAGTGERPTESGEPTDSSSEASTQKTSEASA
ncbi:MAG: ParA family protein [Betaproteobacteria bacterium]|nr:MAG: ParA family protein [Betaproteobacteria bacterium]